MMTMRMDAGWKLMADLIMEQLARNRAFLGEEGLGKVRGAFVVVVGCGGVGSHAATALARSGVGQIRLVDFDRVSLSSLNRHAVATLADVGTSKVDCLRRRLEQVAPWVRFECRDELFVKEEAGRLLEGRPDFVLDCIDNIDSKVGLLEFCAKQGLGVVSSMGAGCKSDPTRLALGDISVSIEDPLSRSTRRRLKMAGVSTGVPAVFSTEKPGPGKAALLPLAEEEFERGEVGELSVLPDFRVRILPVLGTMPAAFGYAMANFALCRLSDYPTEVHAAGKFREKLYDGILGQLQGVEERLARRAMGEQRQARGESGGGGADDAAIGMRIPVSKEDVGYVVEEVWRGRSVVSGLTTRLALIRWERPPPVSSSSAAGAAATPLSGFGPDPRLLVTTGEHAVRLSLGELVCMTRDEAFAHERQVLVGGQRVEEVYGPEVLAAVATRRREEAFYERYR